ncbi:MAG: LuxR C-terminal-related transcriptional regulator [Bacteroidia bacterium]|nr:LuxR C-terminal-related transcriptional regulator [Bacteroidia bacterium]
MKIAELLEANYNLLGIVSRLGMGGSCGDITVDEFCEAHSFDPETFVLICNVYTFEDYIPDEAILAHGRIEDIVEYLHLSHVYYREESLAALSADIKKLIEPCSEKQQRIIWQFYADYRDELEKHFEFEEEQVFPYISSLIGGHETGGFSIEQFEENHSNIDEKLSDLKNLVMKSLPAECDDARRTALLFSLYRLQNDLGRHTALENNILTPMARIIERRNWDAEAGPKEGRKRDENALSEREKEILVCVAMGMLNKEIADKYSISIYTVISHRKNITRKIGIKTVAGLTVYALLNGLLDINAIE